MFTLNEEGEFDIDAKRLGGKTRFINHDSKYLQFLLSLHTFFITIVRHPNCRAATKRVLGNIRIGIYASKKVKAGTELFLNYGTNFWVHGAVQERGTS